MHFLTSTVFTDVFIRNKHMSFLINSTIPVKTEHDYSYRQLSVYSVRVCVCLWSVYSASILRKLML